MKNKKVVVIGGGTGTFTVLSGLKKLKGIDITAIVASTDSGGSTGRLRDEFGFLPVGDLRQCLVALADDSKKQLLLRELFSYRFAKGEGLIGHSFGNLFMTAVRDIVGNEIKAIDYARRLLNIKHKVYPVTLESCNLVAEYENGAVLEGEHMIDEPQYPHDGRARIINLYTKPKVKSHKKIKDTIGEADLIIMGPGDLYTSIIAVLVINNIKGYIKRSKAKLIYTVNLVTKFGQTYDFKASDFVNEMERYLTKPVDHILYNSTSLPEGILKKYILSNAFPVKNDLEKDSRVITADLLANEEIKTVGGDTVKRSLIRHDGDKIAKIIETLL